jgi:hypothetical protein
MASLKLKPRQGSIPHYFRPESDFQLLAQRPSQNVHEMFASFGTTEFLLSQSILPVVSWKHGDAAIRCIGTASVVSCTGYLLTAAHVLTDPIGRGGAAKNVGKQVEFDDAFHFGVIIPASPAYGAKAIRIFEFEKFWLWGEWQSSPLFNEPGKFDYSTDTAICKIQEMPHSAAHQPLNMSLNPFAVGEEAYSIGYAEMPDIPLHYSHDGWGLGDFELSLWVSIGKVMSVFPQNHVQKQVPTPGPCFDFEARIPGKMSGAPVFGAGGIVIRGVVSRSFSGERHAYGSMLGPVMDLHLTGLAEPANTLRQLMDRGNEGMAITHGAGL